MDEENQNKLFKLTPKSIKAKIYSKMCTNEQLEQLFNEWKFTSNTEMIRLTLKQCKKIRPIVYEKYKYLL